MKPATIGPPSWFSGFPPRKKQKIGEQKAGLRRYGQIDPKIFGQDAAKASSVSPEKPEAGGRRKTAEKESQ